MRIRRTNGKTGIRVLVALSVALHIRGIRGGVRIAAAHGDDHARDRLLRADAEAGHIERMENQEGNLLYEAEPAKWLDTVSSGTPRPSISLVPSRALRGHLSRR